MGSAFSTNGSYWMIILYICKVLTSLSQRYNFKLVGRPSLVPIEKCELFIPRFLENRANHSTRMGPNRPHRHRDPTSWLKDAI